MRNKKQDVVRKVDSKGHNLKEVKRKRERERVQKKVKAKDDTMKRVK